jgi:hypothetical protein
MRAMPSLLDRRQPLKFSAAPRARSRETMTVRGVGDRLAMMPLGETVVAAAARTQVQFTMREQEAWNWCFAAVAVSVSQCYDANSTWRQCDVANEVLPDLPADCDCCQEDGRCDKAGLVSEALTKVAVLDEVVSSALSFDNIQSEIAANRVVPLQFVWSGGDAHVVVIYRVGDGQSLSIRDSREPDKIVTTGWDTLRTRYDGKAGNWTNTYRTERE